MRTRRDGERGLPDQIVFAWRDLVGIAAGNANGKPGTDREPAFQKYLKGDTKGVKARAQIRA